MVHNAALDFAALETAFGYKHKSNTLGYSAGGSSGAGSGAAAAIDPYILIRGDNKTARTFRTSTIKDPSRGCFWEETLRVWCDAGDSITVYLVDDNLFKDTYVSRSPMSPRVLSWPPNAPRTPAAAGLPHLLGRRAGVPGARGQPLHPAVRVQAQGGLRDQRHDRQREDGGWGGRSCA